MSLSEPGNSSRFQSMARPWIMPAECVSDDDEGGKRGKGKRGKQSNPDRFPMPPGDINLFLPITWQLPQEGKQKEGVASARLNICIPRRLSISCRDCLNDCIRLSLPERDN